MSRSWCLAFGEHEAQSWAISKSGFEHDGAWIGETSGPQISIVATNMSSQRHWLLGDFAAAAPKPICDKALAY